jgi:predicted PurR-regulated permease PerM
MVERRSDGKTSLALLGGVAPLSVAAAVALLYFMSSILIPCAIALVLVAMFDPLFERLGKYRIPLGVGVFIAFVVLALIFFILGSVLYAGLFGIIERWEFYSGKFQAIANSAMLATGFDPRLVDIPELLKNAAGTALGIGGTFMGFLGNAFVVLLLFAFAAFEKPKLLKAAKSGSLPVNVAGIVTQFDLTFDRVSRFFAVKVLLSAVHGIACWIIFKIMGVDFAELWAALAFAMYMIPVFGSPLVSVLAATTFLLQSYPDWGMPLLLLLLVNVSGTVIGSIIDPALSGHELDVSPLLAMVSLLFWGWIWGITGAILAIPLTALARVVLEQVMKAKPSVGEATR